MNTRTYPEGVLILDTHHMGRPHVVATYVLLGDEPALVDPGPAGTLPNVEAALAQHDMSLADIRHIVVTHIHLDHAGASGLILERNPNIRIHVHERGAPHLIDPSRLIKSAGQLWGDQLETLWGRTVPAPAAAIETLVGGERLRLGGRMLCAYDAPGHARHHLVWYDEQSGAAFVGDNTGVRLPLERFTRPATPPPEVDIEAWLSTLDMIAALNPQWIMLTHFGAYNDVTFHLADVRERLLRWAELVRQGMASGASEAAQIAALEAQAHKESAHLSAEDQAALTQQSGEVELSWRGLARYWAKRA
ncbi:MBL fold metallo-hydrolase [Candidatus Viridilinea mediisalina]|uniref:MBL fold metallo-hydrolase n=1 Tax=Candidatus Viridilinea mediisalina TaxID=2024553 RepID=A0A2A6RID4_9CHLR|nr:MBL fold metallo-hydrolase [Candidatus Viridilinea mediisalina]PDW02645.1 MBL fold metallo-hydrolase [Candidatus Viridilinea mediisalina]